MKRPEQSKIASGVRQAWTAQANRLARQETGQSQVALAVASGVPNYVIKQWEAGRFRPPSEHVEALRTYFECEGLDLAAIMTDAAPEQAPLQEAQPGQLPAGFTHSPRPGFFISDQIDPRLIDQGMERMEANDDRIAALIGEAFQTTGFFGDVSEDTEAKARELVACLAENHVIFRALQGRNIVSMARDEPKTIGDYLGKMLEASPILPMIVAEPEESTAKRTRKTKGERVAAELEG